jgi:hypothetical protein
VNCVKWLRDGETCAGQLKFLAFESIASRKNYSAFDLVLYIEY